MKALIQRMAGDNIAAETIIDELCVSENVCTERGKAFLYSEGFDVLHYEIDIPYRKTLSCGDIIEVLDISLGEQFYARVAGWGLTVTSGSISQKIILNRSILNE